ncbi:Rust resistance kinase Lr10 [Glycine soja]|uniref:non-specific serine/threonine protein kinase n=1 Tax=Glycine soja TaxID=3848 RepID=A0A445G9Y3_GLYSO|nr:Rust resistance kinase Lr10 [Glycine soja]
MHPNPYHYHPYKPKLPMTTLLSPPQIQTIVATSFINLNPHKDLVATMIPNPLPRPCHPYQSKPMTIVVRDLSCGQSLLDSQDMISCPIYVSDLDDSVLRLDLTSCTKMFDIVTPVLVYGMQRNSLDLRWLEANSSKCKAKGKKCKWKNNKGDIECFDCSILLGFVVIAIFKIIYHFRQKEEDQARVKKFLEEYRAEKPARFTNADVKRITGGFKEKSSIIQREEGKEFINELEIMGKIHHINVVRLLGYCAKGIHRALAYNLFPNGSLQSIIFPPDDKQDFLGWEKLQNIALGIAKGIEYLHQGCNHPIIHFDINPHNVLLDDNFTLKISDFGLAKLCSKNPSLVSMTAARGTFGYIAPEVFSRNFGNVSYKSDIYSYRILLDMSSPQDFHVLYPDWMHDLVHGDVHIHVEDDGDVKIA